MVSVLYWSCNRLLVSIQVEWFLLETVICEQHPLDARDRMADRCPLFSIRRQIGRPRTARGGDYDRTFAGRDRRSPQPVEQPLLQRAPGEGLGRLRQGNRHLLAACRLLYRARGLSALSQSMASDP